MNEMRKKDDLVIVRITDLTAEGEGVGKLDTFALFVKDALPGDTVECRIMKVKKSYGYGKLIRVIEPSPDRVEARCPKARPCGGCQIQEMDYRAALRFKTVKVREALKRIGGFPVTEEGEESAERNPAGNRPQDGAVTVEACIGMEDPWRYRNKALIPFGTDREGRIIAGFYAGRTHTIVETEDCLLSPPEFGEIVRIVRDYLKRYGVPVYDETTGKGLFRHLMIRKGFSTGELMVCLIVNGETLPGLQTLGKTIEEALSGRSLSLRSLSLNVNTTPGNVILSPDTRTVYGEPFIEDLIGDLRFRISPNSFFQVNPVMTGRLYEKALEFAGLTGRETVWDLYCGIGTISLFLSKRAGKVYGVEIVPQAVRDARKNALLNGIENAEFFEGKAEEVLPRWAAEHPDERIDVIVTDPPREGCDRKCLDTMLSLSPDRIVYVSCNPATLARDLRVLSDGGYELKRVQPADMFPFSGHVETVCLLSHQKKDFISVPYEPKNADYLKKN